MFTRTYEDEYEVLTEILRVPMWGIIFVLRIVLEKGVFFYLMCLSCEFNSIIHQIKYLYYLCVSPKGLEASTEATSLGWSNPAFVFL